MWTPFFLLAFVLCAQEPMLTQADAIAHKFHAEVAKAPPPPLSPQPQKCLERAANWFAIDLEEIEAPALETLNDESLWDALKEIGVQGVYLRGLKQKTAIGIDPRWGSDWTELSLSLQKKGMALIGDSLGSSTGIGPDFCLAVKNVGDYPGLYHLVEIEKKDWKWLPPVTGLQMAINVPWLKLQQLHKLGYVPEEFAPFVKESRWNATGEVKGADGKVRRWIYLRQKGGEPAIDWLSPSFAGIRIAAADALDSMYNLGEKIVCLNGGMSGNAKETLALWVRKLGGFSVEEAKDGLDEMKTAPADLIADTLTRPALLHALIAEDAEALRLMYRLFHHEGIETKRLVHTLQPFDEFTCDWSELLLHPKRRYEYYEEILTGEALRIRLIKEDAARIAGPSTWPGYCAARLGIKELEKGREEIAKLHLLLAFFYAMQPGTFSFSVSDLLGTLSHQTVRLMQPSEETLYACLPSQMNNPKSFAMQLRNILQVRKKWQMESGELISLLETDNKGLLLLLYRLNNSLHQLLAINFGRETATQTIEMPALRLTTAIDPMTGLAEKKGLDSATLRLELPPLSGKVILFQPKYYD